MIIIYIAKMFMYWGEGGGGAGPLKFEFEFFCVHTLDSWISDDYCIRVDSSPPNICKLN